MIYKDTFPGQMKISTYFSVQITGVFRSPVRGTSNLIRRESQMVGFLKFDLKKCKIFKAFNSYFMGKYIDILNYFSFI